MSGSSHHGAFHKRQARPRKHIVLFLVMGLFGTNLEIISRAGTLIEFKTLGLRTASLAGWTSLWMFPIYGLAGLGFGQLNEWRFIRRKSMLTQCALALLIAWTIEFVAGCILNLHFGLALWDYSNRLFNLNGQISLHTGVQFFLIAPLVFWADDMVRWLAYHEERPFPLGEYYKGLITFKGREERAMESIRA